jgi:hypothetical protein
MLMQLPIVAHAEKVLLKPYDCGPLARGELGVVFSVGESGNGQAYFVKGNASHICPKLMSAKGVFGFESDYCENYEPVNPNECGAIKIFTIIGYQNGSNM